MKEKTAKIYHFDEKIYTEKHLKLFSDLRDTIYNKLELLSKLNALIYGSVARGDVHSKSDIDIAFLFPINEFKILNRLESKPLERWLVQATPLSAVKGLLIFYNFNISFPIIPLYPREEEFYHFGGSLTFKDLKKDKLVRTPGVNKKLLYIKPTDIGHLETRITSQNANLVAKELNISIELVLERIRILERRDNVGRTGVFIKRKLSPTESFGQVLEQLKSNNPATRRRIKRKKI
ncbi:MAG: DNA polymerase subunit beta [Candidatus Lokiarchaeota archaeon]|nr:DNA polymerase subunit beta [Candidatus Lokiarchaeota archaeon]